MKSTPLNRLRSSNLVSGLGSVAALLFGMAMTTRAANVYWDGSGSNWQSAASWSTAADATAPDPGAIPGAADVAIFSITPVTTAQAVNLNANQSALGLSFLGSNPAATTLLGGSADWTLSLGSSGITVATSAGPVTIGSATSGQKVALTLAAAQSWTNHSANALTVLNGVANGGFLLTVAGTGNTAISGILSGTGGLAKTDAGTLTLSGANTASGATTLSGGTLNLDYSISNSSKIAGALTLGGGTINLAGGSHVEAVTATRIAQGASFVTRTAGTAVLAQGALTRSAGGAVNYASGAASTTTANSRGIVGPWATVDGANWATGTTSIIAYAAYTALTASTSGSTTSNYLVDGSLSKTADFSLNTLKLNATGAGQSLALGSGIDMNFGATIGGILATGSNAYSIGVSGSVGTIKNVKKNAALELVVQQYNTGGLTIAAELVNNGRGVTSLTKAGTEVLILTGSNTYTGATTISSGVLNIRQSNALGTTAGGVSVLTGAALELQGTISVGAEALTLNGTGVSAGGALRNVSGNNTYGGAITLASDSKIASDTGVLAITGSISGNYEKIFAATGGITAGGIISGSGRVVKTGIGALIFSGLNNFTGPTEINGGTLQLGINNSLGSGSNVTVSADGLSGTTAVLDLNGRSATIGSLTLGGATASSGSVTAKTNTVQTGGAGTLTLGGDVLFNGDLGVQGTTSITGNLGLGTATRNFTVNGASSMLGVSAVVSGTGGLTKAGAGILALSAGNTYTGVTTIGSGTVRIAADSGLGAAPGAATSGQLVFNGGTLATTATFSLAANRGVNLEVGGGTIEVATGTTLTYPGAAAGSGALTKTGAGTLTLTGESSYSGVTTISGGILQIGAGGATGSISGSAGVVNNAALIVNRSDTRTYSNIISGTGTFEKSGTGTLQLTGVNTYTGATTISGGILQIGNGLTDGSIATSASITNNGVLAYDLAVSGGYTHVISGSGTLTKSGAGTLTLSGVNTYAGSTTLSEGILRATTSAAALGAGSLTLAGGELQLADNSGLAFNRNTTVGGSATITSDRTSSGAGTTQTLGTLSIGAQTLSVAPGGHVSSGTAGFTFGATTLTGAAIFSTATGTNLTLGAVGGAATGFTKQGAGQLSLAAAGSFTGGVTLSAGVLQLGHSGALNATSGSENAVTFDGGSTGILRLNGNNAVISNLATNAIVGSPYVENAHAAAATLTVGNSANLSGTFAGVLRDGSGGGALGLTKAGTGTFTLSGVNSHTGLTTVSAGTLKLQSATALGDAATGTTIAAGAVLDLAGQTIAGEALTLSGTGIASGGALINGDGSPSSWSGAITLAANSSIGGSGETTLGAAISGNFSLTKTGTGVVTLGGNSIYTGVTTLSGGSLIVNGSLSSSSAVSVAGATNLAGLGTIGGTVTVANNATATITVSGNSVPISGTPGGDTSLTIGNLTFSGAGMLQIGSLENYTSSAALATGTLTLNGAAGAVTLALPVAAVSNGTYHLISYTTFSSALTGFTVTGPSVGGRQSAVLQSNANFIDYVVAGDTPYWTGAVDTQWEASSKQNWNLVTGNAPTNFQATDVVLFNDNAAGTGAVTVNIAASVNPTASTFDNATRSYTLQGAAGVISGSLVKSGAGTLTITNANAFSSVRLTAGGLEIGNNGAIGSGLLTLEGGTLCSDSTAARALANPLAIAGNVTLGNAINNGPLTFSGTVDLDGVTKISTVNSDVTFSGIVSGSNGGLKKAGSGTLTFSNNNNYNGDTTITAGTLAINSNSSLGASGSMLIFDGSGTLKFNAAITAGRDYVIHGGVTATIDTNGYDGQNSGIISGSGNLTKTGAGKLTLTGLNTSTGVITVSAGTLQAGDGTTDGYLGGGSITNNATLIFKNNAPSLSYTQVISGTGNFIKEGTGSLILTGLNTYTGSTTISSGTLVIGDGGSNGTIGFSSGITNNGTLTHNVSDDRNFSKVIAGSGTVIKAGTSTLTLSGANTFTGQIHINNGAVSISSNNNLGAVTAGATVNLNGGALKTTTHDVTLDNSGVNKRNIVLGASGGTLDTATSGKSLTVTGVISGSGPLTKAGVGTLVLSGVNTYTGATSIQAGTVSIAVESGLGAVPGTTIPNQLVLAGGTLATTGTFTMDAKRGVELTAASTIDVASGSSLTIDGVVTGNGGFTKTGAGTLELYGRNTFHGNIYLNAGTIEINTGLSLGTSGVGTGDLIFVGSGTLKVTEVLPTVYESRRYVINSGQTATIDTNSHLLELDGEITGSGNLLKTSTGTLTLQGNSSYTGTTALATGVLNIQHANALGSTASGTTISSGAVLEIQGGISVGAEALSLGGSGISNGGALRNISGNNAFGGLLTLTAATRITSDVGSLSLTHAGTLTGSSFALSVGGAGNTSIASIIGTGSGTLTMDGSGTLTLSGNNTFTGATTVSSGVINLRHGNALGTSAGGLTVASGAALELQSGISVGAEALSLGGTGISSGGALRNVSENNTYGGLLTLTAATRINSDSGSLGLTHAGTITGSGFGLTVGGAGDTTLASILGTAAGTLTKDGSGRLTLTGANTFTGVTTVTAGALNLQHAAALGTTAGGATVADGAALELQGGISIGAEALSLTGAGVADGGALRNVSGNNTYGGLLTLAASARINSDAGTLSLSNAGTLSGSGFDLTVGGAGHTTLAGILGTGAGSLFKDGDGTLTLSGNNTYSGATTVSGGVLTLGNANALGSADGLIDTGTTVASGAALELQGVSIGNEALDLAGSGISNGGALRNLSGTNSFGGLLTLSDAARINSDAGTLGLTHTGTVVGNGFGLTVGGAGNTSIASILGADLGSLTKDGTGTLTLTKTNLYTGATTVSGGKLVVGTGTGSITSAVTVQSGGSLGGTGQITGAVSIESGGFHAPGNGPGIEPITGNVSYASGSIFEWELTSDTTTGRGSSFDGVNVTGNLSIGSTAIFKVILNVGSTVNVNSTFWTTAHSWPVFSVSGTNSAAFQVFQVTPDSTGNYSTSNGHFSYSAGTLNWSPVPESSSALVSLLLAAGLLRRRRAA